MSPKIYSTKDPLNVERIRLSKPTNKNGSHFIKTLDIDNAIYFLSPKCFVKQGFVKSGKKIFCDFVFSNDDSDFLAWLENLEESSRKCIYENRDKWFEVPLDEHDIESSMSPPYKPYKSGKFFIVRANVPTALDKINIKIYDENETETDPENVKENTKVLAVFEFQGIRCSVRSFQFEIELKQMLILEPEKLFEKCIIGSELKQPAIPSSPNPIKQLELNTNVVHKELAHKELTHKELTHDDLTHEETNEIEDTPIIEDIKDVKEPINLEEEEPTSTNGSLIEVIDDDIDLENISNLNSDTDPPLRLKSRNDVYYKLYKDTRQRAREAKREALTNYLEAKRIKNTYLLEDLSDSDSDEEYLEDMN